MNQTIKAPDSISLIYIAVIKPVAFTASQALFNHAYLHKSQKITSLIDKKGY